MQFTFSGNQAVKDLIDGNRPKFTSRSKFMLILIIEAIANRQKAAIRKKKL